MYWYCPTHEAVHKGRCLYPGNHDHVHHTGLVCGPYPPGFYFAALP